MKLFSKEVILDFDYTLFDAHRFKQALAASLKHYGVRRQDYFVTYPQAVTRYRGRYRYSLQRHVSLMRKRVPGLPYSTGLKLMNRVVANTWKYLYPDTRHLLKRLHKQGFRLILVTHGNPGFQRRKLQGSRIRNYFDRIVYSDQVKIRTLSALARRFDEVFFISDHPKELADVKRNLPRLLPVMKLGGYGDRKAAKKLAIPGFRSLQVIEKFILNYYSRTHKRGA